MPGALITILKIFGTVLLSLFLILLISIFAILFVPVRYKVRARFGAEDNSKDFHAVIRWLLGIFYLSFSSDMSLTIRIFGIRFIKTDLKSSAKEKDEENKDTDKNKDKKKKKRYKNKKNADSKKKSDHKHGKNKKSSKKKYKFTKESLFELLRSPSLEPGVRSALNDIYIILKEIFPRFMSGNLTFGFDAPDKTGLVYGVLCILHTKLKGSYQITPDFEKEILNGDFTVKGRIFIIIILRSSIRLIFNRDLKKLISHFEIDKENK
ncbi:MAG: hypothetical protein K6D96_00710 [Acetatifactor sp.]|nr:hypothetical protein [Acetatifactor sp.]